MTFINDWLKNNNGNDIFYQSQRSNSKSMILISPMQIEESEVIDRGRINKLSDFTSNLPVERF